MAKCYVCAKEHPEDMTACSRSGGCENLMTNAITGARTWACKLAVQHKACNDYCQIDEFFEREKENLEKERRRVKSRCSKR